MTTSPNSRFHLSLRFLAAAVVFGIVAGACSGVPAPEDAESCEELVGVGVDWVKRTAAALEGQPLEVVTGDVDPPEEIAELQGIGAGIDARATELGCDPAVLNAAIGDGVADLQSDDPVVSLFLRLVQSG